MKELHQIDIIDSISTDLHQSFDDLFDILKRQQKEIDKISSVLVDKKIIE